MWKIRNAYKILVKTFEDKTPVGKPIYIQVGYRGMKTWT